MNLLILSLLGLEAAQTEEYSGIRGIGAGCPCEKSREYERVRSYTQEGSLEGRTSKNTESGREYKYGNFLVIALLLFVSASTMFVYVF